MIGQKVSRYTIRGELGKGGMGTVYRAEDEALGRQVALKILPPDMASDPESLRRFQREAKTVAALNHPSIVTIFSVEEAEVGHFITMELVEGESLERRIPSGGMSLPALLEIAVPLVEALGAAHQKGVVHRDLKPANIMVSDSGLVKVLDFGLAKLHMPDPDAETLQQTLGLTRDGTVLGTVPYMSPEQVQSRPVDTRTDVFSLGVILYEMSTGDRPFQGASAAELMSSILRDSPPPVNQINVDLPNHLGRIVRRCLEKDPNRRYQTVVDLRNELEELRGELASASEAAPSIAVLPFADLSPDKDQDYFCEGLAEELINALVKIEGLRVASRAAAFQIQESVSDLREIGRRLNVETVLGGSVRKAGDRLRITAQLTKVADGYHMWSERYDRQLEDVFAIQDEIAENIVKALQVTLKPEEVPARDRAPKVDAQAYDYYLKGRKFFYQFRRQGFEFARQMFARAIVIDPAYARAFAGVADCCSYLYMYFDSTEENLKEADSASRKAVQIDPGSAEAHASRGLAVSLRQRFEESKVEFETAIRLDPRNFDAHYLYARSLASQGKHAEAAELFHRASEINADDYNAPLFAAQSWHSVGEEEKSESAYRRGLEAIRKHLELNPDDSRAVVLGAAAFVHLGEREEALQWASRASAIDPGNPSIHYNVACTYAQLGEIDRGIDALEQSITTGMAQREWIDNDPDLDPLRGEARFQELLERFRKRE